jgi:hypothetical protein
MKTYTSSQDVFSFFREAMGLYRIHSQHIEGRVGAFLRYMKTCEERLARQTGMTLEGSGQDSVSEKPPISDSETA